VTDASSARRVAEEFSIAGPVERSEPFGAGLVNDTFLVNTSADDVYVLQRINLAVFGDPESLMRNVGAVSDHLSGRFVPELVEARSGGWIVTDGADAWRMWYRVRDATPCGELTPRRVRSAARLLGRFHLALDDLAPTKLTETIPHFHDPARRLVVLRDAVAADSCGRVRHAVPEIDRAIGAEALAAQATEFVSALAPQIAHNDAQMNNILFREDDAVCLVDLDTVMPTARFWDVGDLLRSASTRGAEDDPDPRHGVVDPALFRAIVDGYRDAVATAVARGSVEDEALELAGPLITYEQALRFLTDYLQGDVYYRTTRAGQNLDRARSQLALLASMQGSVAS
jgi:Ser/Thr protein kinase RdoA (MazF antagonist)